ncbi:YdcF family protein [Amnibacterium flavum]|uniref:YdcF family protein n=1 Tax=Amnibacterium flavum TaxID=2173173 RepID=A0A2V1HYL8_9MICO|nr:YdcF family protein [Amnibacterium flavum]
MSAARTGSRRVRTLARVAVGALGAVLVWVIAGLPVFVFPVEEKPAKADVVLVIGPVDPWRMRMADQLLDADVSDNLLVSAPTEGIPKIPECVDDGREDTAVHCEQPAPFTTRGEARYLAREMEENGWSTAIVITATPHIARTRMLMDRCVPDGVSVMGDEPGYDLTDWGFEYVYQTAAFAKAAVLQGC